MAQSEFEAKFGFSPLHTLGFLASEWITAHCPVPGGVFVGDTFELDGWQLEVTLQHYRIKPRAKVNPRALTRAFHFRRSFVCGAQKIGKSPWAAALCLFEGVGPAQFDGWAKEGEFYACYMGGCDCGWIYYYEEGEAKGTVRRQSLIAVLGMVEGQVLKTTFAPMKYMVLKGPLKAQIRVTKGELHLPNGGQIVPLSSKADSKIGQPFTFAIGDESGLYTRENKVVETWFNIRRAVGLMQGRTIEATNPPEPMANSQAKITMESRKRDIYKWWNPPPPHLDYSNPADRKLIHRHNYKDAPWVDVKSIDADADEMVETDPEQAERFFGNRMVQGKGAYLTSDLWESAVLDKEIPDGTAICLGFDGSRSGDWTALRIETLDGHRFTPTYGPDNRETYWAPDEWNGRIPKSEVDAAVREIFKRYNVVRFYFDPAYWETQGEEWAKSFGDDKVVAWQTNQISRMHPALVRYLEDLTEGLTTHDDEQMMRIHALAARKVAKPGDKYILAKPSENQKIDLLMADVLAHEAAADARALGLGAGGPAYIWLDDDEPEADGYEYHGSRSNRNYDWRPSKWL